VRSGSARLQARRTAYRVVDEYSGDTLDEPKTCTSLMTVLQGNFEDGSDGMDDFFNAESEFYPCFDEALREQVYERFRMDSCVLRTQTIESYSSQVPTSCISARCDSSQRAGGAAPGRTRVRGVGL
jgi:hypothetical protein